MTQFRTCIGCRERSGRTDLLRVVLGAEAAAHGGLVVLPDPRAVLPGRGAWVHPGCVEVAERRKAFTRALRVSRPLDTSAVRAFVAHSPSSVASMIGAHQDEPPMSAQP